MRKSEEFYQNGFATIKFQNDNSLKKFLKLSKEIYDRKLKKGFKFITKEKYKNSLDLRPEIFNFDKYFVDFLFDQKIPEQILELTGKKMTLIHIKTRINLPGTPYTAMHRDTHNYKNKWKGNTPPILNLHIYPKFNDKKEVTIKGWRGTHLLMLHHVIFDYLYSKIFKPTLVYSDNNSGFFLDTSIIHQVSETKIKKGALRIMYSFGLEEQKYQFPQNKEMQDYYIQKLKKLNL